MLERFLPRFNRALRRRATASASRPGGRSTRHSTSGTPSSPSGRSRTVARDNTVKYHWRTLQLLPSPQRPSYAGARVRGAGAAQAATRGAPPGRDHPLAARPAPLGRAARAPLRAGARPRKRSSARLRARLRTGAPPGRRSFLPRRTGRPSTAPRRRPGSSRCARPPSRQQARWKAIRQAQLVQGLSMRATARVLGISRDTVSAYLRAGGPPRRQGAASSTEQRPAREDIFAELLSGQRRYEPLRQARAAEAA